MSEEKELPGTPVLEFLEEIDKEFPLTPEEKKQADEYLKKCKFVAIPVNPNQRIDE